MKNAGPPVLQGYMSRAGLGCKRSISWGEHVEILAVVSPKPKNADDVTGLNFAAL